MQRTRSQEEYTEQRQMTSMSTLHALKKTIWDFQVATVRYFCFALAIHQNMSIRIHSDPEL